MIISSKKAHPYFEMFLLSILILYVEVLLIRWVSTEVSIFAYLQNTILVICLFGLGAGCLKPDKTIPLYKCFLPLGFLILLEAIPTSKEGLIGLGRSLSIFHDFTVWAEPEIKNSFFTKILVSGLGLAGATMLAVMIFSIISPLGQLLGAAFNAGESTLKLYSANIGGSLVGVLLFALLGVVSSPPWVWFSILMLLAMPWLLQKGKSLRLNLLSMALIILSSISGSLFSDSIEIAWSPYQKLEIGSSTEGGEHIVWVNNTGYQQIQNNSVDFRKSTSEGNQDFESWISNYDIPSMLNPDAKEVLVVGAGTGNDVAGVLRGTSANITAVEIDPVILDFGRRYHPENPYADSRVNVVVTDARAFFQTSDKKFDLIVFGLLDSHTTPTLTNSRLDHYVYTQEAINSASKLLSQNGIITILFDPQREFIIGRLINTLKNTFGVSPLVFGVPSNASSWGGVLFVSGDLKLVSHYLDKNNPLKNFFEKNTISPSSKVLTAVPTSDDWPYLYIEKPSIPVLFLILVPIFGVIWVRARRLFQLEPLWQSHPRENLHFLGLGTAFTLLQVYGVNQAAIVFGNTWFVNCAIISGILIMILFANAVVIKYPRFPRRAAFLLLFLLIGVIAAVPFSSIVGLDYVTQILFVSLLCGAPMFCSGIIFARSFVATNDRCRALSANLFGALLGGILQLATFALGIKALLGLVAIFYIVAMITDPPESLIDGL